MARKKTKSKRKTVKKKRVYKKRAKPAIEKDIVACPKCESAMDNIKANDYKCPECGQNMTIG